MVRKNEPQKAPINITNRASMILPEFIGIRFAVHNGKKYEPLEVTEQHVGFKVCISPPMKLRSFSNVTHDDNYWSVLMICA